MIDQGGTRSVQLRCFLCNRPQLGPLRYTCGDCGGPLVAELGPPDRSALDRAATDAAGIWRNAGLLPATRAAVTLGEGDTPTLPLTLDTFDFPVYAKVEGANPSLSFKDRAMALGASLALDLGSPGFVVASTGNSAVATATYAAAAGLRCIVVSGTSSRATTKLTAAAAHGAEIHQIEGDYSAAYAHAVRFEKEGWFNATTTYRNPYLAEAYRAIALELVTALGGAPGSVVIPLGAGPLLRGINNGFGDLLDLGLISTRPRCIGVQAERCAPLVHAWQGGDRDRWLEWLKEPIDRQPTVAEPIADALRGYEAEGLLTLDAVDDSGGTIVAVSDDEMVRAARMLAARGILAEPASAATLAALWQAEAIAIVAEAGSAVLMLTGHAIKDAEGLELIAQTSL